MADPSTNTEMVRVPILGEDGRISNDYVPQEIPDSVEAVTQKAAEAAQSASDASAAATAAGESAKAASTSETNAADSAKDASDAATTATQQATAAKGYADTAKSYSDSASQSALSASGSVTAAAKSAGDAATSATAAAASASSAATSASNAATSESNAATSASDAAGSASDASGYATNASDAASAAADSASAALNSKNQAQQILDEANAKFIDSATATTLAPSAPATATVVNNVLQLGIPKGDTGTGIPDGGSAGQVVKKTADGTEWAYDTGAVYNSEEGLQEMSEDGTNDPIYNFGITQGGNSASMSVMGDSPEVAADYSSSSVSYRNAIGADADGPYVDLNLSGESGGAAKYRYIDDVNSMPDTDGIPTAKAAYAAAKGNILTGTKSGAIASVDDAYPSKPRRLTVYGETRQNLWANPSGTLDGVTVTPNADGSVTLSGTNTSNNIWIGYIKRYILKPGSIYTLSVDKALPSGVAFYVEPRDAGGNLISPGSITVVSGVTTRTATVPSNMAYVNMLLVITANVGTAISGTYRVMLNEGSTAQPWCPPGLNSVDELSLVTAGKNLLDTNGAYNQQNNFGVIFPQVSLVSGVTYVISNPGFDNTVGLYDVDASELITGISSGKATSIIPKKTYNGISLRSNVANTLSVENLDGWQLELGSTATDYEPPTVTTTPIDLDGHTLNSLPDGTCDELTIDATGAVTLVKRTNTVKVVADDLSYSTPRYADSSLAGEPDYSGGVRFSSTDQMNNLSAVGDADAETKLGRRAIGVYSIDSMGESKVRVGVPSEDIDSQLANCKAWLGSTGVTAIYAIKEPQTVSLPPVTLPTLPAPNVNVFVDAESSGTGYAMAPDVGMEYERDVNMVIAGLEAKISELTVNQATS